MIFLRLQCWYVPIRSTIFAVLFLVAPAPAGHPTRRARVG